MSRTMNTSAATPATRALDRAGAPYTALPYVHDSGATDYGDEAVRALGLDAAHVFKTLVVELDRGTFAIAVVPVAGKADLKAVAAALGCKRSSLATEADVRRLTGYVPGGVSPVGSRTRLPVVVDESVRQLHRMFVSGGRRGLDLAVAPADLLRVAAATTAPIAAHP